MSPLFFPLAPSSPYLGLAVGVLMEIEQPQHQPELVSAAIEARYPGYRRVRTYLATDARGLLVTSAEKFPLPPGVHDARKLEGWWALYDHPTGGHLLYVLPVEETEWRASFYLSDGD